MTQIGPKGPRSRPAGIHRSKPEPWIPRRQAAAPSPRRHPDFAGAPPVFEHRRQGRPPKPRSQRRVEEGAAAVGPATAPRGQRSAAPAGGGSRGETGGGAGEAEELGHRPGRLAWGDDGGHGRGFSFRPTKLQSSQI
jgi:hypothetical protein